MCDKKRNINTNVFFKNTIFVEVKKIGKNQKHKLFYQITSNMAYPEFNMNKTFAPLNFFFFKMERKRKSHFKV